jgi:hypothetical protein
MLRRILTDQVLPVFPECYIDTAGPILEVQLSALTMLISNIEFIPGLLTLFCVVRLSLRISLRTK